MERAAGRRTPVAAPGTIQPDVEPMSLKKRRKPDEKARKEEVVLLKDLAPRKDVRGGAKLRFGEAPSSSTMKLKD